MDNGIKCTCRLVGEYWAGSVSFVHGQSRETRPYLPLISRRTVLRLDHTCVGLLVFATNAFCVNPPSLDRKY